MITRALGEDGVTMITRALGEDGVTMITRALGEERGDDDHQGSR